VKRAKWNLQVLLLADTPLPILNLGTRWRWVVILEVHEEDIW
jgi:hypothetical protein